MNDKETVLQHTKKALEKAFAGANEELSARIAQRAYALIGNEQTTAYCKAELQANPSSIAANYAMFNLMNTSNQYNKAFGYIDNCIKTMGADNPGRIRYVIEKARTLQLAYNRTSDNAYLYKAITQYESLLSEMPNNISVFPMRLLHPGQDTLDGSSELATSSSKEAPHFRQSYS